MRIPMIVMMLSATAPACAEQPQRAAARQGQHGEPTMAQDRDGRGVAQLPYARVKVFYSLEEYLAHLEQQGAIDLPYWREVEPGIYEYVVRRTGARRERATRAELMRRYGFER